MLSLLLLCFFLCVEIATCLDSDTSGAIYTRWGKTDCDNDAEVVYIGQAGSKTLFASSGGATIVCTSSLPEYADVVDSLQSGPVLYGITYGGMDAIGSDFEGHDVPCVVCRAVGRVTYLRSGRSDCPPDSRTEYTGYLFAGSRNSFGSEYICVDQATEPILGTAPLIHLGQNIHPVEAMCGALPCEDYVNGRELTCAVCSVEGRGSVFPRFGATSCENDGVVLYSGYAAGSPTGIGNAVNTLCLHDSPNFGNYDDQQDINSARIGGIVYHTSYLFPQVYSMPMSCTVCFIANRTSYLQPGRTDCQATGARVEYSGYFFASSLGKGEFFCVDQSTKTYRNSSSPTAGASWQVLMEAGCQSLDCGDGGYVNGREVTCAVCSLDQPGSVFPRWGHNSCENGAEVVYAGVVAGSASHATSSSGANFLCLRTDPNFLSYQDGVQGEVITGTRFLAGDFDFLSPIDNTLAVCAVCHVGDRSSYMVPGQQSCPAADHRLEYSGYLMASSTSVMMSSYICVDQEPVVGNTSSTNVLGLTVVQGSCGRLQCPNYIDNLELTCAVCSAEMGVRASPTPSPSTSPPTAAPNSGDSLFTRWGRTECPSDTQTLYVGQAATSSSTTGGGAQILCLHPDPTYLNMSFSKEGDAELSGLQYETSDNATGMGDVHQSDVPCAVCLAPRRTVFVQMANHACPGTHRTEYRGYMFAATSTVTGNQYVCMDESAEARVGTFDSRTSGLTSPVEPDCGSLPCPPFNNNRELTCVVCSVDQLGSVFNRWGSSECDANSVKLYSGYAGGAVTSSTIGNGLNVVCLHETPNYLVYNDGANVGAGIAGAQFGFTEELMSCAVCHAVDRTTYVQSGRHTCDSGHLTHFKGLLHAPDNTFHRGEYVCVDEIKNGTTGSSSGHVVVPVRPMCGSVPCEPYDDTRAISCAVCSVDRAGSVFTQWGKTSCSDGGDAVYSGVAAIGSGDLTGGGHNALCLHNNPDFLEGEWDNLAGTSHNESTVHGVEYFISAATLMSHLHGLSAQCVVCHVPERSVYMQPGSPMCQFGERMYWGYLMGGGHSSGGDSYLCTDAASEVGTSITQGHQIIPLENDCNSLQCLPYNNYDEIMCAVCAVGESLSQTPSPTVSPSVSPSLSPSPSQASLSQTPSSSQTVSPSQTPSPSRSPPLPPSSTPPVLDTTLINSTDIVATLSADSDPRVGHFSSNLTVETTTGAVFVYEVYLVSNLTATVGINTTTINNTTSPTRNISRVLIGVVNETDWFGSESAVRIGGVQVGLNDFVEINIPTGNGELVTVKTVQVSDFSPPIAVASRLKHTTDVSVEPNVITCQVFFQRASHQEESEPTAPTTGYALELVPNNVTNNSTNNNRARKRIASLSISALGGNAGSLVANGFSLVDVDVEGYDRLSVVAINEAFSAPESVSIEVNDYEGFIPAVAATIAVVAAVATGTASLAPMASVTQVAELSSSANGTTATGSAGKLQPMVLIDSFHVSVIGASVQIETMPTTYREFGNLMRWSMGDVGLPA